MKHGDKHHHLNGATVLILAVKAGNEDLVPYILQLPGVEVDDVDDHGCTALMIDCGATYDEKITRHLLDAGANVNYRFEVMQFIF